MSLPDLVAIESLARRDDGLVRYEVFAASYKAPPPPPCFTFGTMPAHLAPDLYTEYEIGEVGLYRLREAELIFDAIIVQRNAALWSLALNHPRGHVRSILTEQAARWESLPVRRIAGRAAILHGPGFDIFGHWLVDFLPRLHALGRAGLDVPSLKFIVPAGLAGFARSLLGLIGIPEANLVWHDQRAERLAPDELVVPTLLRLRSRFHPLMAAATRFWSDRFAPREISSTATPAGRRIFVSRSRLAGARRMTNRAEIEACAAAAGYEIVAPETLSLPEQVSLFRSARCLVGEYGSGLHGSIFAPPGSVVCALRGTSHHPGFVQSGLAECFGHRIGYVFGETPEHAGDHPFQIDLAAFRNALPAIEARHHDSANVATSANSHADFGKHPEFV